MSATNRMLADGSALEDTHEPIEINVEEESAKWRLRCPNGHTGWEPTNSHAWCRGCRRQLENGVGEIDDAEHWELHDMRTGETVPYSAVKFVDADGDEVPV